MKIYNNLNFKKFNAKIITIFLDSLFFANSNPRSLSKLHRNLLRKQHLLHKLASHTNFCNQPNNLKLQSLLSNRKQYNFLLITKCKLLNNTLNPIINHPKKQFYTRRRYLYKLRKNIINKFNNFN